MSAEPTPPTAARWQGGYIAVLLSGYVVVGLIGLLRMPDQPRLAQLVALVTCVVVATALWWGAPAVPRARGLLALFLLLAGVMWVIEATRLLRDDVGLDVMWLTAPLLLVMLWLKPPDQAAARLAVDTVAWVFIGAVVLSLVMEATGLIGSWYALQGGEYLIEGDRASYPLPLADLLGLDARWAGPFEHPNHAGPVAGFLLVVCLCRRGALRIAAGLTGVLVLMVTGSRTSMVAAVAGMLVVAAAWWLRRPSRVPPAVRIAVVATAAAVAAILVIVRNPGMSGRTGIWPVYTDLWQSSPWLGVPNSEINATVDAGLLPNWAYTAHNLVLDHLVRFGILGTLVAAAALIVALVLAVRAARSGRFVGLGILAVIAVCGISEALIFWRQLAPTTILLMLAVIASVPTKEAGPPAPEPAASADDAARDQVSG